MVKQIYDINKRMAYYGYDTNSSIKTPIKLNWRSQFHFCDNYVFVLEIRKIDNFDGNWNKLYLFSHSCRSEIWSEAQKKMIENVDKSEQSKQHKMDSKEKSRSYYNL